MGMKRSGPKPVPMQIERQHVAQVRGVGGAGTWSRGRRGREASELHRRGAEGEERRPRRGRRSCAPPSTGRWASSGEMPARSAPMASRSWRRWRAAAWASISAVTAAGISRGAALSTPATTRSAAALVGSSASARPASASAMRTASSAPEPRGRASSAARAWRGGHLAAQLHVAVALEEALHRLVQLARGLVALGRDRGAVALTQTASSSGGTSRWGARSEARAETPCTVAMSMALQSVLLVQRLRASGSRRARRPASRRRCGRRCRRCARAPAPAPCTPRCPGSCRSGCARCRARRRRLVSPGAPVSLAMPQSRTYTSPYSPSITLAGLRSRWMTPREWAKSTARHAAEKAPRRRRRGKRCAVAASPRARARRISAQGLAAQALHGEELGARPRRRRGRRPGRRRGARAAPAPSPRGGSGRARCRRRGAGRSSA